MIRYSDHGRRRMARRGVTEEDVEQALRQRIRVTPGEPGSVWVHGYTRGGHVLKVCVAIDDQEFVITAAWPDDRR